MLSTVNTEKAAPLEFSKHIVEAARAAEGDAHRVFSCTVNCSLSVSLNKSLKYAAIEIKIRWCGFISVT